MHGRVEHTGGTEERREFRVIGKRRSQAEQRVFGLSLENKHATPG